MNDFYANENCQTVIHCRGYTFTISELFDIVQKHCSKEQLEEHEETRSQKAIISTAWVLSYVRSLLSVFCKMASKAYYLS